MPTGEEPEPAREMIAPARVSKSVFLIALASLTFSPVIVLYKFPGAALMNVGEVCSNKTSDIDYDVPSYGRQQQHVLEGPRWGCAEILSNASSIIEENPLLYSLVPVLLPHCDVQPDLPLDQLLPDLDFFKKVVDAVQSYPSSIALIAGRGTTATRTIASRWLPFDGYGSVHYKNVHCSKNLSVRTCMKAEASQLVINVHDALKDIRGKGGQITDDKYQRLLQAQADGLSSILACGDCGTMVISDSPYVNMLAELYFALGPETKVILTRRSARDWAASRKEHHGKTMNGLVCEAWNEIPDPFSYSQCASRLAGASDVGGTNLTILHKAFHKYNAYVHDIVRADYLLDVDLFSSAHIAGESHLKMNETMAFLVWSALNKDLIRAFLS